MHRSGTKLLSWQIAESLGLPRIFLEPFTWDRGIDLSGSRTWETQRLERQVSHKARREHERLSCLAGHESESPFLAELLGRGDWDIFKFVEIGRAGLLAKIAPSACFVCLIRDPLETLSSLMGSTIQKQEVIACWETIRHLVTDPLPDAEEYLSQELADCARAYKLLYGKLADFDPMRKVTVCYDQLFADNDHLVEIAELLGLSVNYRPKVASLGESTSIDLDTDAKKYLERELQETFSSFLHLQTSP